MGSIRRTHNPLLRDTQGTQTNPTTATVMADTGAIAKAGRYDVRIVAAATAAARVSVQHRNAANDDNVGDVIVLRLAAAATAAEYLLTYDVVASERVRVMMTANLTGDAEVSIFAERLGY